MNLHVNFAGFDTLKRHGINVRNRHRSPLVFLSGRTAGRKAGSPLRGSRRYAVACRLPADAPPRLNALEGDGVYMCDGHYSPSVGSLAAGKRIAQAVRHAKTETHEIASLSRLLGMDA